MAFSIRILGLAAITILVGSLWLSGHALPAAAPPHETILLVDDRPVLYRSGTRRVLHQPRRYDRGPLIGQEKPWEAEIGYCSVHRDTTTGRYQMWYQAYAGQRAQASAQRVVICYAESDDGIHWVRPELGIHTFNGFEKTNIVLVGNGGRSTMYCTAVLVDPREQDPAKRYKMAYWDFSVDEGVEYPGLCVAFSPDGIHWSKHSRAPLLKGSYGESEPPPFDDQRDARRWDRPGSVSDVIDLMWDPQRNVFVIYAKTWIDGPDGKMYWKRAAARMQSSDFLQWTRPELIIAADEFERYWAFGAAAGPLRRHSTD
ncbi:MAG: hypothetical protein ACC645_20845 [Pirellulales bacterium]